MAKIVDHKYSINDAFRECFFIVPDYQREYVWTDKEVHQLLDDINDEMDGSFSCVFECIDRSTYKYLGENYPYNGKVFHKQGTDEQAVAAWVDGLLKPL